MNDCRHGLWGRGQGFCDSYKIGFKKRDDGGTEGEQGKSLNP